MVTMQHGPHPTFTLEELRAMRDFEWEQRERSYHDAAIDEVNSLVRKYNNVAPYAVRRPYLTLDAELQKAYHLGAEEIQHTTLNSDIHRRDA